MVFGAIDSINPLLIQDYDHRLVLLIIGVICLCSVVSDLLFKKVYNWITLTGMLIGLVHAGVLSGWTGFVQAFLSILCVFVVHGLFFYWGWLGGGDVKLLMAIGAWTGMPCIFYISLGSLLFGSVLGIFLLIKKGSFLSFLFRLKNFLIPFFIKELKFVPFEIDASVKMPFSIPIACAVGFVLFFKKFYD